MKSMDLKSDNAESILSENEQNEYIKIISDKIKLMNQEKKDEFFNHAKKITNKN